MARIVGIGAAALVVLGACSTVRPAPSKREKPAPSVSAEPASRAGSAVTDDARLSIAPPSCRERIARIDRKRPLAPPIVNSSQLLMAPDFDGDYGFYAVSGSVPPPSTVEGGALALELAGPVKRSPAQELELRLTFHNRSRLPLTVVRPLDGTLEHMRDPGYDLYLRDESNGKLYRWAFVGGRCGNVNAIDKATTSRSPPARNAARSRTTAGRATSGPRASGGRAPTRSGSCTASAASSRAAFHSAPISWKRRRCVACMRRTRSASSCAEWPLLARLASPSLPRRCAGRGDGVWQQRKRWRAARRADGEHVRLGGDLSPRREGPDADQRHGDVPEQGAGRLLHASLHGGYRLLRCPR